MLSVHRRVKSMLAQTDKCAAHNSRFDGCSLFDGSLCRRLSSALILRSGFDGRPALDYSALPLKFRPRFHGSLCARSGEPTIINDSNVSSRFTVKWAVERHPCRRKTTKYRVIPPRSETGVHRTSNVPPKRNHSHSLVVTSGLDNRVANWHNYFRAVCSRCHGFRWFRPSSNQIIVRSGVLAIFIGIRVVHSCSRHENDSYSYVVFSTNCVHDRWWISSG